MTARDETYDEETDHVIVLGRRDATEASAIREDPSSLVINGERSPRWLWKPGRRHRVRVINITPDDVLVVSLLKGDSPVEWRQVAKDGASLSPVGGPVVPAKVRLAVGETYDFELEIPSGGRLWVDVRTTGGKWQAQGQVLVR